MAPVDVADSLEMEMAWYLLTVVVRLGRPATASDLAAAAISPRMVERMCRVLESPICLSDGGAVMVSQTAIVAFLSLVGLDVPAPRASLRPYDVRRWWGEMPITYVRKRKAWDAGRSGGKKFRLLAPEADLVEQEQPKSLQLATQSCPPVANGETAIMAFLRLVGLDVPVPRVSLRTCDVRRWWGEMPITYVRKRKAGDTERSCGKRFHLLASDADLVEHEQQKSLQLATQSCPPIANGEVVTTSSKKVQARAWGSTFVKLATNFLSFLSKVLCAGCSLSLPALPLAAVSGKSRL